MTSTLILNIGELVTNSDKKLGLINNAALVIENGKVVWVGATSKAPGADSRIDAEGGCVTPGFVDSHTHLVFSGDRSKDYEARMSGASYATGGINTTVAATRAASDDELRSNLKQRLNLMRESGITTVEIKSGYGLDIETEARILKIAREFTTETTFLGAHVVPKEFAERRGEYIDLVKGKMLDACAPNSKWIDVFCDQGAFTVTKREKSSTPESRRDLRGESMEISWAIRVAPN